MGGDAPQISVAVGVTVGLLASFVQSLGLTIQRKSHLQNEAQPSSLRLRDYQRPLWLAGFAIFICSNLLGTIFQIGALPIVVLGPLGAVSLLYNAFFARVILGDEFSVHLVLGTFLIAGGAVLIGIFGVVPEQTHTLEELVRLYSRPAFIIWITILSLSLFGLLTLAHITEWAFERQCHKSDISQPATPRSSSDMWRRRRKISASHRPLLVPHSQSTPITTPETQSQRYGAFGETGETRTPRHSVVPVEGIMEGATGVNVHPKPTSAVEDPELGDLDELKSSVSAAAIERTRLVLGVCYGTASGTLSGLCLLFAKTGIELLILTVVGQNQFGHYQAWLIVLVLLFAAVLQLFYLNRALRLVGPTLICPLAFCFYNLSSIISGLIYYNQWDMLSGVQFFLVAVGTAILLAGVWIVSIREGRKEEEKPIALPRSEYGDALMTDEPESDSGEDSDVAEEPVEWIPRGLTIGLGAASPGFDIRPSGHRGHSRTATLPSFPSLVDENTRPLLGVRTASDGDADTVTGDLLARRRKSTNHERQRGFSVSGGLFVGGARPRGYETTSSAPSSPLVPRSAGREQRDASPSPDPQGGGGGPKSPSWGKRATP